MSQNKSSKKMTQGRWRQVEDLLQRLESLDAAERQALLDRECANDADLRHELEHLLAELDRDETSDWIGSSIHRSLPANLDRIPERLGRYRVTGEIGRGGLAVVLAGERDDQEYRQEVAIKLIRRGLDTVDLLRRLRQERQILARLNHPNIAALIDGGSTDDGRPFVVMERIDGRPIDEYCASLPLRQRLQLFVEVCEAVQYAHRNLVIHRDIKPANILVTDDGRPKLLDFGIAKVLQPSALDSESLAQTVPGLRLLTPEYASPEQLRGEPLTTATDVYSLGVLLFELLTGERPYSLELGDHQSLEAAILQGPPDRPSSRVRRPVTSGAASEGHRQLSKTLIGDLDNIVLMALRPEPDRRYGSVEQLADDVCRYLDSLPVRARADTLGYRLTKFVRRHRLSVSIAAVSAVMLIAVSLFALRQAQLANQGRLASDRLSTMLVSLFELPDPDGNQGKTITALEILNRGAVQVQEMEGQPLVRALFMDTMGQVYNNLGIYDQAQQLFSQAVDLRRSEDNPVALAESLNHLGESFFHLGSFDQAEPLFREGLDLHARELGEDRPELTSGLINLGAVRLMSQDLDGAEELWLKALDIRQKHLGDHGDLAEVHDNLAALRQIQGRSTEAEQNLWKALDLHTRFHGEDHPQTARTMGNLATLLHQQGHLTAAESLYRKTLDIQSSNLGPDHPQVSRLSSHLAVLLARRGQRVKAEKHKLVEAEELLRAGLDSLKRRLGPEHHEVTYPMIHLADLLVSLGESRYEEARELYLEVHRIRSQALPANNEHQITPLSQAARLALLRGRPQEAVDLARQAYELSRQIRGDQHAETANARQALDDARQKQASMIEGQRTDQNKSSIDMPIH